MLVRTRDFGEMEIKQEDILTFVSPIIGFEDCERFVLLRQEDPEIHFSFLQSLDDPSVCFVLADPCELVEGYKISLGKGEVERLGEGELLYFVLTVIRDPYYESTVNLKSPLVINPATGKAMQVIVEEDYPIRHLLIAKKEGP